MEETRLIKNTLKQSVKNEDKRFIYYKMLFNKAKELLPSEKRAYWFKRLTNCKTMQGQIQILENIVDYWEGKTNDRKA